MSSAYLLSCDSYKHNIFSGLTRLQEEQEFVDLTLAADGYLVKVHKNVIALASPYLKEMIKSTSSENPVIFLNNVQHDILKYLLEYIYNGEVNVPQESLQSFIQISASLHITGINKIIEPKPILIDDTYEAQPQDPKQNPVTLDITHDNSESPIMNVASNPSTSKLQLRRPMIQLDATLDENERLSDSADIEGTQLQVPTPMIAIEPPCSESERSNFAACITINSDHNLEVQQYANVPVVNVDQSLQNEDTYGRFTAADINNMPIIEDFRDNGNYEMTYDANMIKDQELNSTSEQENQNATNIAIQTLNNVNSCTETPLLDLNHLNKETKDSLKIISQYSVSERGAIQIVVSRYIYCSHHRALGGRKHRWRCLEYRRLRCPAYIDSFDGHITSRKGGHSHPFHDDKIYKKHNKKRIFYSYKQALEAKELPIVEDDAYVDHIDVEQAVEFSVIGLNTNKDEVVCK